MKIKKIIKFLSFLAFVCLLGCMQGCKEKDKPTPGPVNPNENKPSYWDQDGNGIEDWTETKCTITFSTWAYTDDTMVTIDYLMAQEFMKKYPNITVEFVTVGEEWDYDANMLQLLETQELPDVFLIRRLETFLPNSMLLDISEMYDNDPDTKNIFESLKHSGVFDGKRYAIPTYVFPQFWLVNKSLLESKNIPAPTYDWTWDEMEAISKAANDETSHTIGLYGRQGVYGEGGTRVYMNELPKVLKMKQNKEVGSKWAGWGYDGTKFNFSDDVFLEAMNKLQAGLNAGWIKTGLSNEQKLEYYNDETFIPTTAGKVAIWAEASWSFKDQVANFLFDDWDVYPGPSGVTSGNTDIAGISSLCKNKQAAYQFLKWMSYGEEGILSRFHIYETSGSELYQQGNNYPYPIVDYGFDENGVNKIWSSIPYGDTAPGLVSPKFIEALRNGAYTLNKEVCGWDAVDYAVQGYFNDVYSGATTFAAVRQSIQDGADTELERIIKSLRDMLK